MEKPYFYSLSEALILFNQAEKKGEAEASFKGYGKDAKVFTARIVRGSADIGIYIDNKLIKTGQTEGEILDVLTKEAEGI